MYFQFSCLVIVVNVLQSALINGTIFISIPTQILQDPTAYTSDNRFITIISSTDLQLNGSRIELEEIKPDGTTSTLQDCRASYAVTSRLLSLTMALASECSLVPIPPPASGGSGVGPSIANAVVNADFPLIPVVAGSIGGAVLLAAIVGGVWYFSRVRRYRAQSQGVQRKLKSSTL